ncbi:MAG: hypothetical protein JO033_05070 [Acidobacteriaceae bacterium]|nr:hypothetical protein [Acidobacteriaceae bacterium]
MERVRDRVTTLLQANDVTAIVSSSACGADLVALQAADALGIRRRVVLPFSAERFRVSSVIDRPGEWGSIYDNVIDSVAARGDLVELQSNREDGKAYAAANLVILNEAEALARESRQDAAAVLVWDGASRGEGDLTVEFGQTARARGLKILEVKTV